MQRPMSAPVNTQAVQHFRRPPNNCLPPLDRRAFAIAATSVESTTVSARSSRDTQQTGHPQAHRVAGPAVYNTTRVRQKQEI